MFTKTLRGLMISTFMIAAVPAMADGLLPGSVGATVKGSALVSVDGMSLYTFDADVAGNSTCNNDCAAEWIPMPVAADAVAFGDWTIVTRDDGSRMWAFKGKPVYTSVKDKLAGEVNGDPSAGFHLAEVAAAAAAQVDANGMISIASKGVTTMGDAWIDAQGMALYTYEKDVDGRSLCNGDCAVEWPPMAVQADAVASGDWTIIVRDDGSKQWALKGQPLYTFAGDKAAGQVTGDNVDGFHLAL